MLALLCSVMRVRDSPVGFFFVLFFLLECYFITVSVGVMVRSPNTLVNIVCTVCKLNNQIQYVQSSKNYL